MTTKKCEVIHGHPVELMDEAQLLTSIWLPICFGHNSIPPEMSWKLPRLHCCSLWSEKENIQFCDYGIPFNNNTIKSLIKALHTLNCKLRAIMTCSPLQAGMSAPALSFRLQGPLIKIDLSKGCVDKFVPQRIAAMTPLADSPVKISKKNKAVRVDEDDAAMWILKFIGQKHNKSFVRAAKERGFPFRMVPKQVIASMQCTGINTVQLCKWSSYLTYHLSNFNSLLPWKSASRAEQKRLSSRQWFVEQAPPAQEDDVLVQACGQTSNSSHNQIQACRYCIWQRPWETKTPCNNQVIYGGEAHLDQGTHNWACQLQWGNQQDPKEYSWTPN